MLESIHVHTRVLVRHPELTEEEVVTAWRFRIAERMRLDIADGFHVIAVGFSRSGKMLEMVAFRADDHTMVIFHAMRATKKAIDEVGLRAYGRW